MRNRIVVVGIIGIALTGLVLYGMLGRDSPKDKQASDAQSIATNLETAWSLAFAPDGRLFVTERAGRIRIIDHDKLLPEPWATLAVYDRTSVGYESGLLGLAIDPEFEQNKRVYVCFTQPAPTDKPSSNLIGVMTESGGKGTSIRPLLTGIAAGPYHNGCRL